MSPRIPFLDSADRSLDDHPRPLVAVTTALLTIDPDSPALQVLLVRSKGKGKGGKWTLPNTFLNDGETLISASRRTLKDACKLTGRNPQQLLLLDDPKRDDRGWSLNSAHIDVAPWKVMHTSVEDAVEKGEVRLARVGDATGLGLDHDRVVTVAVDRLRDEYAGGPDPRNLLPELFTLRQLQLVHEAVAGEPVVKDTFRRRMEKSGLITPTDEVQDGTVGKPARLFRRVSPPGRRA